MTVTTVPIADYLADVLGEVKPLSPLQLALLDALGSTLADDVSAPKLLPPCDIATASGYAVAVDQIKTATPEQPVALAVIGDLTAGAWRPCRLTADGCFTIAAGSPLPVGADAIVPPDWTDRGLVTVRISGVPRREEGVLRAGATFTAGTQLGVAGQLVTPGLVGLLASAGFDHVMARPRPRVVTMAVGADHAGVQLGHYGQVADAASYLVTAAARDAGAQAFRVTGLGDDPERVSVMVADNAMRADLLVTTGDASLVAQVFDAVRLVNVPVTPSGVMGFGHVGPDSTPLVCLPSQPSAAYVGFELIVRPMLRRLLGCEQVFRRSVKATLASPLTSVVGLREFRPGTVVERRGGGHLAHVLPGGAHQVVSLATATALIVLPDQLGPAPAGMSVDVLLLDRD